MTMPSSVVFCVQKDDDDPPSLSGGLGVGDLPREHHDQISLLGDGDSCSPQERPASICNFV